MREETAGQGHVASRDKTADRPQLRAGASAEDEVRGRPGGDAEAAKP